MSTTPRHSLETWPASRPGLKMLGEGGCAPSPGLARIFGALADFEPSPDLYQDLKQLALVRHRLDLPMSELVMSFCDSRIWEEEAYCRPVQWLRKEAKLPSGVAKQQLDVGLRMDQMPRSMAALEQGEIGFGHLALMAVTAPSNMKGSLDEGLFLESR